MRTRVPSRPSAGYRGLVVPDNTRTAVIKACLYEPQVNRTYTEMSETLADAVAPPVSWTA